MDDSTLVTWQSYGAELAVNYNRLRVILSSGVGATARTWALESQRPPEVFLIALRKMSWENDPVLSSTPSWPVVKPERPRLRLVPDPEITAEVPKRVVEPVPVGSLREQPWFDIEDIAALADTTPSLWHADPRLYGLPNDPALWWEQPPYVGFDPENDGPRWRRDEFIPGWAIRKRRRLLKITQARLGEMIGLPQGYISKIERDRVGANDARSRILLALEYAAG